MPDADNENIRRTIRLTRVMLSLADEGDRDLRDPSCAILYGMLRDMAYKLRRAAEEESEKHRRAGRWADDRRSGTVLASSPDRAGR